MSPARAPSPSEPMISKTGPLVIAATDDAGQLDELGESAAYETENYGDGEKEQYVHLETS